MEQRRDRLNSSASLEKSVDLDQRLEKKAKDVNSFNNHINNIREMITYFEDKTHESEKK